MPAISVIMPVYNSEKYLHSSITSVLRQTFTDIELILIDDGSTDSSGAICESFAAQDKRVVFIRQENHGVCWTRNRAIRLAAGEYIALIDNDDWYMPTLLEDNYALAVQYGADMVKFGRVRADMDGDVLQDASFISAPSLYVFREKEIKQEFACIRDLKVFDDVWDGLYRTSFFRDYQLQFDTSMRFGSEDSKLTYQFFQHTKSFVINPKVYYIYFKRTSHSISAKFDQNIIDSLLIVSDLQSQIWEYVFDQNVPYSITILWAMEDLIIILQRALLHRSCPYSFAQKKDILRSFKEHAAYHYPWNKEVSKKVFQSSKTKWLMAWLLAHDKYGVLLRLSQIYQSYIRLKRKKVVQKNITRFENEILSQKP